MTAWRAANLKLTAVALLLTAATLFLNLRDSKRELLYDDYAVLTTNTLVAAKNFGKIWTSPYWAGVSGFDHQENLHRPIFLSVAALLRGHTVILRFLVTLGHLLVGLLGWMILDRNFPDRRWLHLFLVSVFLLHPAQVETTVQVIGLMEVFPAVMGLAALWVIDENPWWALGLVALAPGIKEIGYAWLGCVSLIFLWRRLWPQAAAAFGLLGLWLSLRYLISGAFFESYSLPYSLLNPLTGAGFWDSLWTRPALLGHNLRLFFWPAHLSSDYSRGTLPLPGYLVQVWVLAAFAFGVYLYRQRKSVRLEAVVAMASVLPTLQLTGPTGIIFAERYGYAFRLGLVICLVPLVIKGWERLSRAKRGPACGVSLALALVALLYGLSWKRHHAWINAETLFTTDLRTYPQNAKLHFNLGVVYGGQSRWLEAKRELEASVESAPDFPEAHFKLGFVYRSLGREELAQREWHAADELGYNVNGGAK